VRYSFFEVSRQRDRSEEAPFAFIGRNIRDFRKNKKWTQAELGQRLTRRKLSRQAIIWIESGRNTDLETIADIAAAMGVALKALTQARTSDEHSAISPVIKTEPAKQVDLVEGLLAAETSSWIDVVSRDERYQSPQTLIAILDHAAFICEKTPQRCRDLGKAAARIADLMNASGRLSEPDLRVRAWKDLAWVTSRLGDHAEALRCVDIADSAAATCSDSEHQKAIVEFARSIVLTYMEQYTTAREHLLHAREAFEKSDRRRYLLTFHQDAIIQSATSDPRAAAQSIEGIIDEISSRCDEDEIARLCTVAAHAWSMAGEAQRAAPYVRRAAEINVRLGNTYEMALDLSRQAALTAELGDLESSFPQFERARKRILELGLQTELINLDFGYLRAKVAAGCDTQELHAMCSRLAAEATAAGLPISTSDAIDWLRQISEQLSMSDIGNVEALVSDAQTTGHTTRRTEPRLGARAAAPETDMDVAGSPHVSGGRKWRPRSPAKTPSVDQTPPTIRDLVDQLLSRPASTWMDIVKKDSRYCSEEVLKALLDQATAVFYNLPRRSHEISFIAARLADLIHDTGQHISPELRVQAWRDLAYGTSRIGSHNDALRYLEIADTATEACADPVHQGAIVEFVRSIVLTNMEEYADARKRLLPVREVLERVDRRRYLLTFHHEALIETLSGDPQKAAQIIDRVIREISTYDDEDEMSQLYTVASYAKLQSGEPQLALDYLRKSEEISTRKGDLAEIARNLCREAACMAALGDYETAFTKFDEGREKLMALGLREDLISLNLDYLREKAAAGAESQELLALCSQIASDASAAALPVTVCEALDWLRRIAERLRVEDVDRVYSFVKVSQLHPARTFEPPEN
jgi:transcriptional regulator with XRE-family HTH domain